MAIFLFSYGTLQEEKVQLELFGRRLNGDQDILRGFQVAEILITEDAFLSTGAAEVQKIARRTNDKKDLIHGTVFEISEQELHVADHYEPKEYKRTEVELESGKKTWIYIAS